MSTSTFPLGHVSDLDIFRSASRRNNDAQISGVILRGRSWFCQVLEGDGAKLEAAWSRIRTDPRHGNIRHWWQTEAPSRLFANWHSEHWGISRQVEEDVLSILHSDDVPTTDKITLVRVFAQVRRSKLQAKAPGFQEPRRSFA